MPEFSGIHHVALSVTDLERSVPFYEKLWGNPPVAVLEGETFTRRVFRPAPTLTIGLTQHEVQLDGAFSPTRPGLDHIGFRCGSRAELVEWSEHLDCVGIAHSDIVDGDSGTALSFKDPDNIALEFYVPAEPAGV